MHHRLLILTILASQSFALAKEWPQWRGPNSDGIAAPGDYPVSFSASTGILWKASLPGIGSSTPSVWGEQIFVTAGAPEDTEVGDSEAPRHDAVIAFGMDGKEQWRVLLGPERKGKHRNGSGSNPSPVTDGKHLFAYFKSGTVAAVDYSGKLVWRLNLQELYGEDTLWWDLGSSPALVGDLLVIAVMQAGESYLVALEKASGKVAWKTARQYDCKKETDQSYTTPTVIGEKGREEIITWGADHLTSHRPSDGKLLWQCGGFNPEDKPMWRVIATPAITDGIAFVPYGRTKHVAAVKLGGEGDITETARLWEKEGVGTDVPSPIGKDGAFFLLTDNGWLHKFDAKSGDEHWKQRLPRSSSKYYASPLLAGDLLYCIREDGWVFPLRLKTDGFEVLGENDMGERIIASPIAIDDKLLIRGAEHLFAIAASN